MSMRLENLELLQARLTEAELERVRLEKHAADLAEQLKQREHELHVILTSKSWRMTHPFRRMRETAGKFQRALQSDVINRLPRRTVFIECTHTFYSDVNSGIQRVVRNVVRNAPAVGKKFDVEVVPVIYENGRYIVAAASQVLANKQTLDSAEDNLSMTSASPVASIRNVLTRVGLRILFLLSILLPSRTVKGFVDSLKIRFGVFKNLDQVINHEGNILLLLDSSWHLPIWDSTDRFKAAGGRIVGVNYDLIPITHPHACVEELNTIFKLWYHKFVARADGSIAISRSVKQQLQAYSREQGWSNWGGEDAPIEHFYLGSELDFAGGHEKPSERIVKVFDSAHSTFLMVGSLEPRKMHAYALTAFERLWSRNAPVRLVIIGRQAWKTESLLERIAGHSRLGTDLFLLRDATDDELEFAYHEASALIIASEIEGFGLPIVESFQRGLPVLCSDIPVFREVAGENAEYFDLDKPDSLANAVEEFCAKRREGQNIPRKKIEWLNWRQSTEQLFGALDRIVPLSSDSDHRNVSRVPSSSSPPGRATASPPTDSGHLAER